MANPVCNMLGTLLSAQGFIYNQINKRVAALRRLAAILEKVGDFNSYIPDINKLIPIVQIDLDFYEELRRACPDLGLPAVTGLDDAKAAVADAYAQLRTYLENHPWNRMGNLQARLDEQLAKVTGQSLPWQALNWISCLQHVACELPADAVAEVNQARESFNDQIGVFANPIDPAATINLGQKYRVTGVPGGAIVYNGITYHYGDSFYGVRNSFDWTATGGSTLHTDPPVLSAEQLEKQAQVKDVLNWFNINGKL